MARLVDEPLVTWFGGFTEPIQGPVEATELGVEAVAQPETHGIFEKQLDALLLALPGVGTRTIHGLDAYFVADRMFACISGNGVGLRLPVATATEYEKDLPLFQAAVEFARGA